MDDEFPPWERPGAHRRDQDSHWSGVFFMSAMLAFVLGGCGLSGYFFPLSALATANVKLQGNLDAHAPPGTAVTTSIEIMDQRGRPREFSLIFTKQAAPDTWNLTGFIAAREGRMISNRVAGVTFNRNGTFAFAAQRPPAMTIQFIGIATTQTVTFNLDGMTQRPIGLPAPRNPSLLVLEPARSDGKRT